MFIPPHLSREAEEVRAWFVQRRGGGPFLSAVDGPLLVAWLEGGVAVSAILRAIEAVAERRLSRRSRHPFTLGACEATLEKVLRGRLPRARLGTLDTLLPDDPHEDLLSAAEQALQVLIRGGKPGTLTGGAGSDLPGKRSSASRLAPTRLTLTRLSTSGLSQDSLSQDSLSEEDTSESAPSDPGNPENADHAEEREGRVLEGLRVVREFHEAVWARHRPEWPTLLGEAAVEVEELRDLLGADAFRKICEELARGRVRGRYPTMTAERVWEEVGGG